MSAQAKLVHVLPKCIEEVHAHTSDQHFDLRASASAIIFRSLYPKLNHTPFPI